MSLIASLQLKQRNFSNVMLVHSNNLKTEDWISSWTYLLGLAGFIAKITVHRTINCCLRCNLIWSSEILTFVASIILCCISSRYRGCDSSNFVFTFLCSYSEWWDCRTVDSRPALCFVCVLRTFLSWLDEKLPVYYFY